MAQLSKVEPDGLPVEQAAASDEEAAPTVTPKKQNTQWLNEQQGQAPLLKNWTIRKIRKRMNHGPWA